MNIETREVLLKLIKLLIEHAELYSIEEAELYELKNEMETK